MARERWFGRWVSGAGASAMSLVGAMAIGSCSAFMPGPVGPGSSATSGGTSQGASQGPVGQAPAATPQTKHLPIYSTFDDPPQVVSRWNEWGVKRSYVVYQSHIDPDQTNRWTAKDLTFRWLGQNVPKDFDGPICLNWEAHVLEILGKGPKDNPEWQPVVNEMVALLKFVREQRPKAKVGYYALPSTKYWNQDETWVQDMLALRPIFEASNALFPSAYDFYGENPQRDHKTFRVVMELALRCAQGKPVYVYTWHRYHDSTPQWGFGRIPKQEYIDHIRSLVTAEWNGDRVDGIVAWGQEKYWHTAAQQRKPDGSYMRTGGQWDRVRARYAAEMRANESFDDYYVELLEATYCRLAEAVNNVPCGMD